jgi:hypothetical protein
MVAEKVLYPDTGEGLLSDVFKHWWRSFVWCAQVVKKVLFCDVSEYWRRSFDVSKY